ncbi:PAS domain S-box-containing protein/diguanylate cyclase (GGDEF)-like protein [Sphaerotilus hippei]|uniref:PAS domain S-box-containing protein/diguanylate cyclase (GGDEF)-like protein n=1 Tax=Sphaerotilus hippei TaxID=744406 RepID=A0A318GWS0_9BURK|nr:GGDEF domain-containing phosphodiesterase [Sphaerotilus hippei]PXW93523.1 PAS domain S-box-containing protein/diguanylate cyclase (GGDEF)-like protein [Sphaerotilus hippei]
MSAKRIVTSFLAFGTAWILASDRAIDLITRDAAIVSSIQSAKGLVFVGLSALLIYVLVRHAERSQAALKAETVRQRDRLAHILDVSPAVIYTLSRRQDGQPGWDVDFISQNVEQVTGHGPARWSSRADFWREHIHPDDRTPAELAQQRLMQQGTVQHEYRFRHADGRWRWINDTVTLLRDAAGQPVTLTGAWLDVTDRKQAELATQASEHRYHELFDLNPLPMWVHDLETRRFVAVNAATTARYGYSHAEFSTMTLEDIQPEAPGTALPPGESMHRRRDGTSFRAELSTRTLDREGRAVQLVLVHDLTDRLDAQEHARLIAQVFESSQEGIFITDAQTRFLSVNGSFTRITGYSDAEVQGHTPALLKSGRQDRLFYAEMWARIKAEGRWEGEIWNRRKNGEIFPEWLTISAIQDSHGTLQQYLGIFTETSNRKAAEERILRLSNYDTLTDLPNRTLLAERARVVLAAAHQQDRPALLMHLNVDHFGGVNESLGHDAGDQVLRELAQRLSRALKPEDILCRLGGDDFILLLPGSAVHDVAPIGLRLMEAVARPMTVAGQALRLSASIGVAEYPGNGKDLAQLTQAAELAVHLAKREGRNTMRLFSLRMQQQVQETLAIARDLRWAVERRQLVLHYQPQVDALTHRLVGVEALVRWQHPQWGLVSPARFIPIAEDTGLIQEIGTWVLHEALRQNGAWQAAGLPIVPMAVNLSVAQFRHPLLHGTLAEALRHSGQPAHMLELELTESVAMEDSDFTVTTIAGLKQLGVSLSIDDFGTGYSSLSYLKRFKVDKLKIDQSFVRGLNRDPQDEAIVDTVISLARSLGLRTIAEGVETSDQLQFLQQHGCDEIQGYLFSRPVPADAFPELLRSLSGIDRVTTMAPHPVSC